MAMDANAKYATLSPNFSSFTGTAWSGPRLSWAADPDGAPAALPGLDR